MALVCLVVLLAPACRQGSHPATDSEASPTREVGPEKPSSGLRFVDGTAASGLDFRHRHGGTGHRYMVETMAGGGGFVDFDRDGDSDIYLIQSGPLPWDEPAERPRNELWRNRGDGTFEEIGAGSGVDDPGYGMGVCFADVDNDGWSDFYVTNYGPNRLFRNRGDGSFADVTEAAGVGDPRWSTACAFADVDRDGCLDLYVVNYVGFDRQAHRVCGPPGLAMYCHPDGFDGSPDVLYRNRCDGTFEDATEASGLGFDDPDEGKGLGAVFADLDDDGDQDLYVSNDSTRNFLFENTGAGEFREVGILAGAAFNAHGRTEAGMGVALGDVDDDGALDLFVTNLDFESNTLYLNRGGLFFDDATSAAGLVAPSLTRVGFGTVLFDADLDADLDLFVANGHILDNVALSNATLSFAQPDQLFENLGAARFVEVGPGPAFSLPTVSRAAAVADVDDDGDSDLLVVGCNEPARLLINESHRDGEWFGLRLHSRFGGRDALGARVVIRAGGKARVAELTSGSSYLAQNEARLVFAVPAGGLESVEVRWPEGDRQTFPGERFELGRTTILVQDSTDD